MSKKEKEKLEQTNLKFPYPVLNDKRDFKSILNILSEKENEIKKKIQQAKLTYKQSSKEDTKRKDKLKQLYKNFRGQLFKIDKQLEFIKLNLKVKKILKLKTKKNDKDYKSEQLEELNKKLNELISYMKDENKKFLSENKSKLKCSKEANDDDGSNQMMIGPSQAPVDFFRQVPPPNLTQNKTWPHQQTWNQPLQPSQGYHHLPHPDLINTQPPPPPPQFMNQYYQQPPLHPSQSTISASSNTNLSSKSALVSTQSNILKENTNNIISNNLAISIAQTAAAAHAAAAIAAAAFNPPPPPTSNPYNSNETIVASLPNRNDIDNAVTTFSIFKNKIVNFLGTEPNVVKYTDSLKTINSAYIDDEDENRMSDDGHHDDDDEDQSDTELDIVLTSNATKLRYILPPAKACGLQASIISNNLNKYNEFNLVNFSNNKPLLAAQNSSFSLTFMGVSSIQTKGALLSNILFKNK